MVGRGATRVSTVIICCSFLLTTIALQDVSAQNSTLRANSVVLNYKANSGFQPGGVQSFLTSSWGQLYWIDGGPFGQQLEVDTGSGTSVNAISLSSYPGFSMYFGDMVNGPDGAMWLTGGYEITPPTCFDQIYRLDSTGKLTNYPLTNPTCGTVPSGITVGSDGALWFTQTGTGQLGRITTAGVITEFASPCNVVVNGLLNSNLETSIVSGSDGNLWFECEGTFTATIYKMTTAGQITAYPLPAGYGVGPTQYGPHLAVGPDGNVWFGALAGASASVVGSVSPTGAFNFYPLPASGDQILSIVSGPDGALWATGFGPALGRITTSGQVTLVPVSSNTSIANFLCQPEGANVIGLGPRGSLVFDDGRLLAATNVNSCFLGSLTPGASSLWPATGTTPSPAPISELEKASSKPQSIKADGSAPGVPVTCGVNVGCDLSVVPQDGLVAYSQTVSKEGVIYEESNTPQVTVTFTSISNAAFTIGLGVGTDPSHNYGTCTDGNGGPLIPYLPLITSVPTKEDSVVAVKIFSLRTAGKGTFDCEIPLHIVYSDRMTGIQTYLSDSAVTIEFHSNQH